MTISYPEADAMLGEALYPDEAATAQQIADAIAAGLEAAHPNGGAPRDAHPKAHGLQRAEFRVRPDLPPQFATGVFVPGKTYQAYLRFSNGNGDPTRADDNDDGRGLAIKLLGVPGDKAFEPERTATTQDFILINYPMFFINEPHKYLSLVHKAGSKSAFVKATIPFAIGLKSVGLFKKTSTGKIANPLQVRYYSATPYQLGLGPDRIAIKFSVVPASDHVDELPANPSHDYLREAMAATLRAGEVTLKFLIQPRTSEKLSVEDSMTAWDEADAPFHEVATIAIPKQDFDTPELNALAENLSFNPWHCLPEHRPLGAPNRMRKVIYDRISATRHRLNAVERREP